MHPLFTKQLSHTLAYRHWKKIGINHHHGINVHLSSIHSKNSCGIGEYTDLKLLINWCKKASFNLIQLLPLNDTGYDSSPYNPISTFALNPTYLGLSQLPYISLFPSLQEKIEKLQKKKKTKRVHYRSVRLDKLAFLREYFDLTFSKFKKNKTYTTFIEQNPWLKTYSLFLLFIELHRAKDWKRWPEEHKNLIHIEKKNLFKTHKDEISFYSLIQFLCFQQLKEAKKIADEKNLYIMGDIPFLISPNSYDAWEYRSFFNFELSVGSPPDKDFTPEGQDWRLPAYNWKELEKRHYNWWKSRLSIASSFYHLYRIDHVIGFFRVWAMKWGAKAKNGDYVPKNPDTWLNHGIKILKTLLKSSSMLPIGEDLLKGLPQAIRDSLSILGICGTRVVRWETLGDGNMIPFSLYHPLTVTTLSTHDTETFEEWWKKCPKQAKPLAKYKGWKYPCEIDRKKRLEILYDSHHTTSLFHINMLQEYLALFPNLIHKNLSDERINLPGTVSTRNWSYRFIPSLEELHSHKELIKTTSSLINASSLEEL